MYIYLFGIAIPVNTPANSGKCLQLLRLSLIGFASDDSFFCEVESISWNVVYMNFRLCRSMKSAYNNPQIVNHDTLLELSTSISGYLTPVRIVSGVQCLGVWKGHRSGQITVAEKRNNRSLSSSGIELDH